MKKWKVSVRTLLSQSESNRWNNLKREISLSPRAIAEIQTILSSGRAVYIKTVHEKRGTRLVIKEHSSKTKYDVVFSE